MRGHFNQTLSGLVCHPNKEEIVTCGGDCLLSIWDIKEKKQLIYLKLDFSSEALDLTKAGNTLAVGCSNGHVMIYDYNNLKVQQHIKDRTKPITVVKFCPRTKILAIGGKDCLIILYNI